MGPATILFVVYGVPSFFFTKYDFSCTVVLELVAPGDGDRAAQTGLLPSNNGVDGTLPGCLSQILKLEAVALHTVVEGP